MRPDRLEAPGDKKDLEEECDLILATYNDAAKKFFGRWRQEVGVKDKQGVLRTEMRERL